MISSDVIHDILGGQMGFLGSYMVSLVVILVSFKCYTGFLGYDTGFLGGYIGFFGV
jgi:hypothetical protein